MERNGRGAACKRSVCGYVARKCQRPCERAPEEQVGDYTAPLMAKLVVLEGANRGAIYGL